MDWKSRRITTLLEAALLEDKAANDITTALTVDPALRERLAAEGKPPATVIVVAIKAVYMHCAKAFMRSQLWEPQSWPDRASLPTLGQILKDQLALTEPAEETDRWLADAYAKSMW